MGAPNCAALACICAVLLFMHMHLAGQEWIHGAGKPL
jgi:hypothetical protein